MCPYSQQKLGSQLELGIEFPDHMKYQPNGADMSWPELHQDVPDVQCAFAKGEQRPPLSMGLLKMWRGVAMLGVWIFSGR